MATAKEAPVVPVPPNIILELSREEAKTLYFMTGKVTGSTSQSRRKHTDAMYEALHKILEVQPYGTHISNSVGKFATKLYGSIGFNFDNEEGI